jgi:hypothetical protein
MSKRRHCHLPGQSCAEEQRSDNQLSAPAWLHTQTAGGERANGVKYAQNSVISKLFPCPPFRTLDGAHRVGMHWPPKGAGPGCRTYD